MKNLFLMHNSFNQDSENKSPYLNVYKILNSMTFVGKFSFTEFLVNNKNKNVIVFQVHKTTKPF